MWKSNKDNCGNAVACSASRKSGKYYRLVKLYFNTGAWKKEKKLFGFMSLSVGPKKPL